MRLIDADELLKGRTDHEMISTHLIFNAPTVDVLNKIRAEIEEIYTVDTVYEDVVAVDKTDVLQIIDKYR